MIDTRDLRDKVMEFGTCVICSEELIELISRLEAAEKERDELLAGLDEWIDKTEWVQRGINEGTISAKYLGLHRADVMTSLLGEAEKERDALRAKISEECDELRAENEALAANLRGKHSTAGATYAHLIAERDALRAESDTRKALIDLLRAEIGGLRAKIAEMEKQEPVGVLHVGSYYGEELQDWEFEANQCACDKLNEAYVSYPTSLPLYAIPGAQGEKK